MVKGFVINKIGNVTENLHEYRERGALKGKYLGFENIQKYYTMSLPGCTDWTGLPQSGKTELLMEFLVNTSKFYGWKHLIYAPDIGNENEIYADIVHKISGKTFDKRYKNRIQDEDIDKEMPWVYEHFKVLTKEDPKATITPIQFWDLAVMMKETDGIHTATIDSWKDLKHEEEGKRTDIYLREVLSYRNALAEKHFMHFHTVIHSLKTEKDSSGERKPPTPYDYKGGGEWFDNGKCMITVHRRASKKFETEVYFNKIKPRSIGSRGMTKLMFDPKTRCYYYEDMGEKYFASQEKRETKSDKLQTEIEMNVVEEDDNDDIPF